MVLLPTMRQLGDASASEETIDHRLTVLAARHHGVFSRRQAVEAGASRGLIQGRLATSRWERLYPGVYRMAGAPALQRGRLLAACLAAGQLAVASHRSAATLKEIPGGDERLLELSVLNTRRVRLPGILVHAVGRLDPVDVTIIDAIPATTATRTLIDLAGVVSEETLELALDDVLRRRLTTLARLRWRMIDLGTRGRPGVKTLRGLPSGSGGRSDPRKRSRDEARALAAPEGTRVTDPSVPDPYEGTLSRAR